MKALTTIGEIAKNELRMRTASADHEEQAVIAEALPSDVLLAEIVRRHNLRLNQVQSFMRLAVGVSEDEKARKGVNDGWSFILEDLL
jgi:hypothetical protein